MSGNNSEIFSQTIEQIFQKHNKNFQAQAQEKKKTHKLAKRELELALTVILVELASSDQNFDTKEYTRIASGLKRVFGTTREEVTALVNQANLVLSNLRGSSKFSTMLKENLTLDERKAVLEVIDDVIDADGVQDGYETYLRGKFVQILDVPDPQAKKV